MVSDAAQQSSKSITVSKNSKLAFHELITRKEDDAYVIGRKHTAVYAVIPPIGLETIDLLKQNHSIAEVADILSKKYKESIVIDDFIEDFFHCLTPVA